jgi:hypothetical protein
MALGQGALGSQPLGGLGPEEEIELPKFETTKLTSSAIPEAKAITPELLIPGRKPIGPVEINWQHSLSQGLIRAYLLPGVAEQRDLVIGTRISGTTLSEEGKSKFNGTNQVFQESDTLSADLNVTNISVASRFRLDSGTDANYYVAQRYDSTDTDGWWIKRDVTTDKWEFTVKVAGSGTPAKSLNTSVQGEWVQMVGTYNGTSTNSYINGESIEIQVDVLGNMDIITEPLYIGANVTSNYFNGLIDYLFIWDRPLSNVEIQSFNTDPYQFLKPRGAH